VDVTGMESRRCDDVIRPANPPWPVNRWLTAMVRLFRPQIEWRIRQRDDVVADWQPVIRTSMYSRPEISN
jgi:hypothetical protein